MKRLLSLALVLVCLILTCGCGGETESDENKTAPKAQFLHAWSGNDFSEEKLISVIEEYQKDCVPIEVKKNQAVVLDVGFEAERCFVSRLSRVDDTDINIELNGYIDSFVDTECDGKGKMIIDAGWWYSSGEYTQKNDTWSYLVRAVNEDKTQYEYYYFRVHFNK